MKRRVRNTLTSGLLACAMAMTAIGPANIAWAAEMPAAEPSVAEASAETTTATPAAETPVADTPANDTPVADTPANDTPVADTPANDTPATELPADGQETENGSVEKPANANAQNYLTYGTTVKSYLSPREDGGVMSVQFVGSQKLLAEYYDASDQLESSIVVNLRLPKWGAFYETEDNYFVLTGQNNADKTTDDGKPKFNIAKYDKDWKFLGEAELKNCDTYLPFDESARMAHAGKYLLIRTGHRHLPHPSDGNNHQSNMTIVLDMESMQITSSFTGYSGPGYASHSFNQFIKVEGDYIAAVDHGDTHPRGVALTILKLDESNGTLTTKKGVGTIFKFQDPSYYGDNQTGASVGGFEISRSSYLVAGNSNMKQPDNKNIRNVFVVAVDKHTNTVREVQWLTDYAEGDPTASTPHMVKLDDDHYAVLWSTSGGKAKAAENTVYYTTVDAGGNPSGEIHEMKGTLSDCAPIVIDGKVVWHTIQQDKTAKFFDNISVNELTKEPEVNEPGETSTSSGSSSSGGWIGPAPTVNTSGEATITFNANGGMLFGEASTITRHGTCYFFPTASKNGYIFDGWYTHIDGGTKVDWTVHFDYDCVLYAHWREDTPREYTAVLDANGGTLSGSSSVSTVQHKLAGLPQPTRDGYAFQGWYTAEGVQVTDTYLFTADVTLQARWKELDYKKFDFAELTDTTAKIQVTIPPRHVKSWAYSYGTSESQMKESEEFRPGQDMDSFTIELSGLSPATAYRFQMYYVSDTDKVTSDTQTFTTKQAEYTVTFDANGGTIAGDASLSTADQKLPSLPDAARDGYTFTGWSDSADGGTPVDASYVFHADSTVYAQWIPDASQNVEKAKLQSVKSPSKGKLKVSWKLDNAVNGYQIAYSKSKSFPSKKTSVKNVSAAYGTKTFSVLSKGKTYYVRVRAYKKVDGRKVYGSWSNVKKATVKK